MRIMEKKEYIVEAKENETYNAQLLTEVNIKNFMRELRNYLYLALEKPHRITISEYSKINKDTYTFKVTTWEGMK